MPDDRIVKDKIEMPEDLAKFADQLAGVMSVDPATIKHAFSALLMFQFVQQNGHTIDELVFDSTTSTLRGSITLSA